MTWNWQLPDWPNFAWDRARLRKAEEHFLVGAGVFAGTLKHLPRSEQEQLTIEAISTEAVTTSEIEGEILNRACVQSSIRRQFGLAADKRRIAPAGPMHEPRVHFEAPPSMRVPEEIARFIDWFNRTAPSGAAPLHALTRAGIAHLYFESIHPFEDGNGRIGRAIAEKALAQSFGQPTLTAFWKKHACWIDCADN
jgi:Fic family protein